MDKNIKKLNSTLILGWVIIVALLIIAYFGEFLKGHRSLGYMFTFYGVTVLPAAACSIYHVRNKSSPYLRYLVLAGYLIMYTFVLFTGQSVIVFTYMLPMLSLIVLYHQPKLVLIMGALTFTDNIIYDVFQFIEGKINIKNSREFEIQIAILITCFGFLYVASKLYDGINRENIEYVKQLDENHSQLQHVTIQTITTIANIIDAKDEYTKGHSFRVAEYSSAIARELGYSEERIQDVKFIGLLHDIGKIGVPDSILNKPGKLNEAEFKIMRSHAEIGGKILNGNRMIDGVDKGALYHHERWDGSGYPNGISGTDIPEIARIIGIADAYDAMTSNRVYRKRLTDEEVIFELKRCSGSQFDPDICKVFVNLLEEGRINLLSPDEILIERRKESDSMIEQSRALLNSVLDYNNSGDGTYDFLTCAYSLNSGEKRIAEELLAGNGGLFIADITNVRKTNEKHGLLAGDRVLRTAAEVLLSRTDMLTVRFSGDQFLCFIPGIKDKKSFEQILNTLCIDITSALNALHDSESNSVAIGAVLSAEISEDLPALLNAADKALYHIKHTHSPGFFVFTKSGNDEYNEKNLSKIDLEQFIKGIEEDSYTGIYNVDYHEFTHVYNFIRNICRRNNQQMQLILMTMSPVEKLSPTVAERDEAMNFLETVINKTLRKVDVMLRFSASQCIILLNNTSEENVELVAERIINSFYKLYDKKNMALSFDTADLKKSSSD